MNMIYRVKTDKSFTQAIDDLKTSLGSKRFGVLWELNFKNKLAEKGVTLDKNFQVLEVCNPNQAKKALETFTEVGFFLPCKIAVYEEDQTVFMGMLRPTELIGLINSDALTSIAREVEQDLKDAINQAR